jgi:hypothetical protein
VRTTVRSVGIGLAVDPIADQERSSDIRGG